MIHRVINAKQDEVEERGHCRQKRGAAEDIERADLPVRDRADEGPGRECGLNRL